MEQSREQHKIFVSKQLHDRITHHWRGRYEYTSAAHMIRSAIERIRANGQLSISVEEDQPGTAKLRVLATADEWAMYKTLAAQLGVSVSALIRLASLELINMESVLR